MHTTAITTLGNAAQRVDDLSKNCTDHTVAVSDISFNGLDEISIAGEVHPMRNWAQKSFCYRLLIL